MVNTIGAFFEIQKTMIDEFLNTQRITDAIARSYFGQGDGVLREFKLKNSRRVDLVTINDKGWIIIIEIKSSPEDFLSDKKWGEYIDWADQFYFGVAHNFPISILPKEHGIITTDGFDVYQAQPSPIHKLNGSRRNNLICKMAKASMRRIEQERNALITN